MIVCMKTFMAHVYHYCQVLFWKLEQSLKQGRRLHVDGSDMALPVFLGGQNVPTNI